MSLSDWLLEKRTLKTKTYFNKTNVKIPEGLWIKCNHCGLLMY